MSGAIALAYLFIGQQTIDLADIRAKATEVGITNQYYYLAGCFYWSFINSLIEECTWRGFVVSQCRVLVPKFVAVILAAYVLHDTSWYCALWLYLQPDRGFAWFFGSIYRRNNLGLVL